MPKFFRFLAICLFSSAIVSVSGCSKKTAEVTSTVLLTTSTWKFSEAGIDAEADGKIDQPLPTGTLTACQTDFILSFKSDKTGTLDEGPTKCLASDPQSTPFTWELNTDKTEITFSANIIAGFGGVTKIVELSATKMILNKSVSVTGIPYLIPITIILVH
ncbi:MAG: lipocalin family protein [Chitinophagaceae bacterium]